MMRLRPNRMMFVVAGPDVTLKALALGQVSINRVREKKRRLRKYSRGRLGGCFGGGGGGGGDWSPDGAKLKATLLPGDAANAQWRLTNDGVHIPVQMH
ncbi:hypothetical protein LSTR_LSTR008742 [Laodelphax striatellus]|uniref:Uncharacterized protein n=1 Tax=Laodelphax striatellus TaxID=195883 RepID=A0A482XR61_LAOST|nr:hypothetical protein LSTR_LSTR008742 [Laodelphax striatellus]